MLLDLRRRRQNEPPRTRPRRKRRFRYYAARAWEEVECLDLRFAAARLLLAPVPAYAAARTRPFILRAGGMRMGSNCMVPDVPTIIGTNHVGHMLRLGDHVVFGIGVLLDLAAPIDIGDFATLGHRVSLITGAHEPGEPWRRMGELDPRPITIGRGCWVASGAIVLPGVTVGAGAVVGAGSVVTRDVPPHAFVAGAPARLVRWLDGGGVPRAQAIAEASRAR